MIRSIAPDGRPDLGGVFQPIDRPRVLERLAAAAQYRIATIIAPAGFGKSVAVRQFLATVPSSVIYDVPSEATALVPFVRGFAEALEVVGPGLRRSLATALEGIRDTATPGRDLATWAATHVRTASTLIVIDDLHVGETDPEISKFLVALVDRTRDGPRWLFVSRSPLQLPIASWLAYGESDLVVDAVDLRFDLDEAKRSARSTRIAVRDDELTAILELTDGWPAALAFALRTSTRASDLRAVSAGTREMVYRYLAEQVWNSLDGTIRDFLRMAAFLPRLEVKLAVAAGFDDARSIIETLRERVAFITVLGPNVYKLHDLFRDFVERQVALEGDDALRQARIRAGRVLEAVHLEGTALERYIDAGAESDVERVLVCVNFALLERGHTDTVERALRAIPPPRLAGSAEILGVRAALEESHGRVEQAAKWYAASIERAADFDFRVKVIARYGIFMQQRGRIDAIGLLEELLEHDKIDVTQRAHVLSILAATYAAAGRMVESRDAIRLALEIADYGDDELRARTFSRAAAVAFYDSDEQALESHSREGIRLATEIGAFGLAARMCGTLCAMHASAGRVPGAVWFATQAAANAEKAGDPYMRAFGLRVLMQQEAERGNAERLTEIERELASISYRGPVAFYGLLFGRIISLGWQGRFLEAKSVATAAGESELLPPQNRVKLALLAIVAAAAGEAAAASSALAEYEAAVARDADPNPMFDRPRALAERFAILATALIGKNTAAHRMLRAIRYRRADLASFDAVLNGLQDRAPDAVEGALREMRLASQAGLAQFIEAVSAPPREDAGLENREGLTAAEVQVLRSMALGLTNQAIADEQHRTVNTVRTHVSAILRKLGAASRGEAVALARRKEIV
ncbi:MAG: regulatory protein LuxR [Candidatus Eremiobacteraeota bacterium]|nr:regulatory protein LuxR [Candidatus Eremiobacteraeota bacterium]